MLEHCRIDRFANVSLGTETLPCIALRRAILGANTSQSVFSHQNEGSNIVAQNDGECPSTTDSEWRTEVSGNFMRILGNKDPNSIHLNQAVWIRLAQHCLFFSLPLAHAKKAQPELVFFTSSGRARTLWSRSWAA